MKRYKRKFEEAEHYVNVDFSQVGIPIIGKKISEVRKLNGKDVIGIVLDDDSGAIIRWKNNKLEILPVKKFTQTEIELK